MIASDFSDVFISYRRLDVDFAKQLVKALNEQGKEVWVDWEDIPPGSEAFTEDIARGIQGADAFLCILTPDYLQSTYCVDMELGYALELKKKIIPIVLKKFDGASNVPPSISHINWIYFTPHAGAQNAFDQSFPLVVAALEQDYEHAREHRRLALRAIDWENNAYADSFLLIGDELSKAESWLIESAGKDPEPTDLHKSYIRQSHEYEKRNRRQRRFVIGVVAVISTLTIIAIGLGIVANIQREEAQTQAQIAATNAQDAENNASTAVVALDEAEANANIAATQAAIAEANAEIAEANALTATVAQGDAVIQANNAQTQAAIAATAQGDAIIEANNAQTQAAIAATAQNEAIIEANNAATSEADAIIAGENAIDEANNAQTQAAIAATAQNLAQLAATGEAVAQQTAAFVLEANANSTQSALEADKATEVSEALATSESNALTATVAQGESIVQANIAGTQAAVAENNAATATIAQGEAILQADAAATAENLAEQRRAEAQAQALIVRAEQARLFGDANVALALALQAAELNPNLLQTQSVMNQAASVSPRLIIANVTNSALHPTLPYLLVQGTEDPTRLDLWFANQQTILYQIQTDEPVEHFAFSLDGSKIITASGEGGVAIWNSSDGTLIAIAQDQNANRVLPHPDGLRFVSAGIDGVIYIRDIETLEILGELRNTTENAYDQMHFNTDGRWLYTWTLEAPFVRSIWNIEDADSVRRNVENYVLVSDDNAFRVNRVDGQFVIYNMDADGVVNTLDGDVRVVYAFTPDNSQLLVRGQGGRFGDEGRLALVNRSTGEIDFLYPAVPEIRISNGIETGVFLGQGQTMLTIQPNNDLLVSDTANGEVVRRIGISSLPITLDEVGEDHVIVYTETNTLLMFDRAGLAASLVVEGDEQIGATERIKSSYLTDGGLYGELYDLDWELTSPSGTYQLSSGDGFNLVLTNQRTNQQVGLIPNRFGDEDSTIRLFSPDAKYVVIGDRSGNLRVWNVAFEDIRWEGAYEGTATNLEEILFLPNGEQFIAFYAETAVLWGLESGEVIREFAIDGRVTPLSRNEILNNGNVHSWMFVEKHNRLLSDGSIVTRLLFDENDLTIYLMQWDIASGDVLVDLNLREDIDVDTYVGARFSPDGQTYVRIGQQDNVVEMFNAVTLIRIRRFIGHNTQPVGVAFNPAGDQLVTAGEDGAIILWDVQTGQLVRTLVQGSPLNGIAVSLNIVFSPDNAYVGFTRDDTPIPSSNLEVLRVETLSDVVSWVRRNRIIRALSCAEREQYSVLPLCSGGVETPTPTPTIPAVDDVSPTPTATPIIMPTATPIARGVIQADSNVNVRSGPGDGFRILDSVAPDTIVIIVNPLPEGIWLEIELLDGTVGWVLDGVVAR